MGLLSSLLGGGNTRRRSYGYGAGRTSRAGYGRGRQSTNFFGSPLGRMALGGLAAYGARRFYMGRRGPQTPVPPAAY